MVTSARIWAPWLALVALGGLARAEEPADPDDIPVVGRPADLPFSEASGSFAVSARAQPTTLEARTPLTFTVTVRALGRVRRPPQRIDLRQVPAFAEHFHIEGPPGAPKVGKDSWEFVYRLKPRDEDVTEVPGFPFAFYNPDIGPPDKRFQVIYTDPIPIRVGRREAMAVPLAAPEWALDLATGPGLLARDSPWRPPGPAALAALLLAPPLLGLGFYISWRRLRPDQVRQALRRRSRAARQALQALQAAARLPVEARAERVARVVADYLRERFDLPAAEPTPVEVQAHLERRGGSPDWTARVGEFLRACDEARFGPAPPPGRPAQVDALVDSAGELVLTLEGVSAEQPAPGRGAPLLSAVLLLSAAVGPGPPDEGHLAARAEEEFAAGVGLRGAADQARPHFRSAAELFEGLRRRGVRNALLFRNLGNAYLLAGDLPRAILSYHQGLHVNPRDRALRQDLARARELVVIPEGSTLGRPPAGNRPPWLPDLAPSWLFAGAVGLYLLACALLTRWLMLRRPAHLAGGLATLTAAALLAAGVVLLTRLGEDEAAHPLVVIAEEGVLLRKGNGLTYPPRVEAPLPRGAEARLLFERDGWLQVELASGPRGSVVGWVPRAYALVDAPGT